jgi:hypothetical protein
MTEANMDVKNCVTALHPLSVVRMRLDNTIILTDSVENAILDHSFSAEPLATAWGMCYNTGGKM